MRAQATPATAAMVQAACAAEAVGDPVASLDALDDALLGRILSLAASPADGPALALVCRRFSRVLLSEPALWRTLRISTTLGVHHATLDAMNRRDREAWYASKLATVQKVAPLVTALAVLDRRGALSSTRQASRGSWGLEDLLGMLRPGVLTSVELEVRPSAPVAALEALPRFAAHLTALNVDTQWLPQALGPVLRQLRGLQSLRCGAHGLHDDVLPAILALTGLQRLELESSLFPLPHCGRLTVLRRLRHLRLADEERSEPLQLPETSRLTQFEALTVFTPGLCEVAGARMRFLDLDCCQGSPPRARLTLRCRHHPREPRWVLGPLAPLLEALLPPGLPLLELLIEGYELQPDELLCDGGQLSTLERLHLRDCTSPAGMEAAARELLHHAPRLASLTVAGCSATGLAACLAGSTGLQLHLSEE